MEKSLLDDLLLISSTTIVLSCFFTTIMLWIFAQKNKAKRVMAITFSIMTLFSGHFFIQGYQNGKMEKLDFIYGLFCIWLVYSIYIYFRMLIQPILPNKKLTISFVATILSYLILYFLFGFIFAPVKLYSLQDIYRNLNNPMVWLRITLFLHYIVFFSYTMVSALKMYRKHKKRIASQFSYNERIGLSWLPYLLVLLIIYGIATVFDIFLSGYATELYVFSNFSYSFFYLICGFLVVGQQDIVTEVSPLENGESLKEERENQWQNIPFPIRMQLKKSLRILMDEEKIYLNPELRLDSVAKILHTNRTYLSWIIKEDFNDNFISFVNHYRIEEAKRLITDVDNHSSLYEIAEQVGFKSQSSFNAFFKRFTNQTPAKFKKSYFERMRADLSKD